MCRFLAGANPTCRFLQSSNVLPAKLGTLYAAAVHSGCREAGTHRLLGSQDADQLVSVYVRCRLGSGMHVTLAHRPFDANHTLRA